MSDLPERIRAFVAVPVPESIRIELSAFQQRLKRELSDVSWTLLDAMHLTLRFLGNIESARLDELKGALSKATENLHAFRLALGDAGSFGNRVIWIGLAEGVEPLTALAERIRIAAEPFSAHEESRAFSAHVTLGRLRQPGRGVSASLANFPAPRCEPWLANRFELIRSELSPQGARYTTLAEFPLHQL
jgi:2'-5' RNA ligase